MAVVRKRNEEIKDLVSVERSEAIRHQMEIIHAWKPQHEMWSIRNSPAILGGMTALSCIFINGHFRKKLRLFNYGKMSSYLPTVVIPSITGALAHVHTVQSDLLLREVACPVCIEMRSAFLQSVVSVVYPLLLAPLANLGLASKYKTSIVPNLFSDSGRLMAFQTWWKFTKPISNKLLGIVLLQGLAASALTIAQLNTVAKVDMKFAELLAEEENE
ncbi:transmembrane protein 126A [Cloeon dipterum]|uniref:transmembrane protein 126A n=1 Tax=Cloeon dipterum TaxID=197152 RepID=UPI00321FB814